MRRSNHTEEDIFIEYIQYLYHRMDDRYEGLQDFVFGSKNASLLADIDFQKRKQLIPEGGQQYKFETTASHFNFQSHLNYAMLILAYSCFDDAFRILVNLLASQKHETLRASDFKGQGIFQSRTFMEKVFCYDFEHLNELWEKIKGFNLIRNAIVHDTANIKAPKSGNILDLEISKLSKKYSLCEIDGFGDIEFKTSNVHDFIKTTRTFLNSIILTVSNHKERYFNGL